MKGLVVALTLALSFHANAQLIDYGNYVKDQSSGLDWLKLENTMGKTLGEVKSAMQGGYLDGWRFATAIEWENLLFGRGFTANSCSQGNFCGRNEGVNGSVGRSLMWNIGSTPTSMTAYPFAVSMGYLADVDPTNNKQWRSLLFVDLFGGEGGKLTLESWAFTFFSSSSQTQALYGSWLVRGGIYYVNAPNQIILFILACILIPFLKLNRRKS